MIDIRNGDYRDVLATVSGIALTVTSPPYNIGSRGERRDGQRKKGRYDPRSYGGIRGYQDGHLSEEQYQQSQVDFLVRMADHHGPDGVLAYNVKRRRRGKDHSCTMPEKWLLRSEVAERWAIADVITWDRGSTHNKDVTQLWAQTELFYILRLRGGRYRFDPRRLPSQYRSDVWRIPPAKPNGHACRFPLLFPELLIMGWSEPGELVCDPYLGSGTTAVAASKLGRQFIGSEIEQKYVDMAHEWVSEVTDLALAA